MDAEKYIPPEEKSDNSQISQNIAKMEELMEGRLPDQRTGLGLGSKNIAGESHAREVIAAYFDRDTGEIINFGRNDQVHESVRDYPTMNIFALRNLPTEKGLGKRSFIEKAAISGQLNPEANRVINETIVGYNIGNAESFEGLFVVLDAIGEIKSSDGNTYSSVDLKNWIARVSGGEQRLDSITRTGGLRDKVEELLSNR